MPTGNVDPNMENETLRRILKHPPMTNKEVKEYAARNKKAERKSDKQRQKKKEHSGLPT